MKQIAGMLNQAKGRYAIVVGRFNSFVVDPLCAGAVDVLKRHGISDDNITVATPISPSAVTTGFFTPAPTASIDP